MRWFREPRWSSEPDDPIGFTRKHDQLYSRFAKAYGWAVPRLPVWKTWLHAALPHLKGPRVLEVAIGPGYLLGRYASRVEAVGVDINRPMLETAREALGGQGLRVPLVQTDAACLPFADGVFDTVVSTMALSGLPRALPVLVDIRRVLRRHGALVLLDVSFPGDGNLLGTLLGELWKLTGDIVRDVGGLLDRAGFEFEDEEIGGFGSVHLYLARPA